LIDAMLVLLIIFIITIQRQTHGVKIDNPTTHKPPPTRPEVVDLSIDFDGTSLWNKTPVNRTAIQGYISQEAINNDFF
jgi:biopolymer transport protein ExbD